MAVTVSGWNLPPGARPRFCFVWSALPAIGRLPILVYAAMHNKHRGRQFQAGFCAVHKLLRM
jgi:hypothetical protein